MNFMSAFSPLGLALSLLTIASGFYLTQILTISPIYLLLPVSLLLSFPMLYSPRINSIGHSNSILFIISIASLHFLLWLIWISPTNAAIGYFLNFIFLALIWKLSKYLSYDQINKASITMINFSIALGIFEAVIRLLFPLHENTKELFEYAQASGSYFYLYKFNGPMYQDSNYVAQWLLTIGLFTFEHLGLRKAGFRILIFIILIILTFCRAAILAFSLYILIRLLSKFNRNKWLVFMLTIFVLSISAFIGLDVILTDDSFKSKLVVFNLIRSNYIENISLLDFIFGVGLSNSKSILDGLSAHNFFAEILIDTGLIGLTYTLYSMFFLANLSGGSGRRLILIFLIAGMSFSPITVPYLFVTLCLLAYLKRKKH